MLPCINFSQVLAFRTFPLSVFTLWRFILGQFDFSKVSNANRFLGPTFFLTFIVFVFIILVNMFLGTTFKIICMGDNIKITRILLYFSHNQWQLSWMRTRGESRDEQKAGRSRRHRRGLCCLLIFFMCTKKKWKDSCFSRHERNLHWSIWNQGLLRIPEVSIPEEIGN